MKNAMICIGAGALALSASPASATTQVVTFLTPGLHDWVVPYTMSYTIYGAGAQGGNGYDPARDLVTVGGLGALVGGLFSLQAGDVLHAYVAGRGGDGRYRPGGNSGGGGGGGATTLRATLAAGNIDALLMVAGGGGGGGVRVDIPAGGGQIGPNGTSTGRALAGVDGRGGGGGIGVQANTVNALGGGGGGSGTLGFGGDGTGNFGGGGGYASFGGSGSNGFGGDGGYGGGGGGDGFAGAGGGGGGFSGGAGGDTIAGLINPTARGLSGGGGGSYMNTGNRLLSFADFRIGNGGVSISYDLADPDTPPVDNPPMGSVPEPATWAMMIAGFGLVGSAMRRRQPIRAFG